MTHTEKSLMALVSGFVQTSCDRGFTPDVTWDDVRQQEKALRLAIREVLAERDALAAAMPSEGADAALAYAAERTARQQAEAECERLRKLLLTCPWPGMKEQP